MSYNDPAFVGRLYYPAFAILVCIGVFAVRSALKDGLPASHQQSQDAEPALSTDDIDRIHSEETAQSAYKRALASFGGGLPTLDEKKRIERDMARIFATHSTQPFDFRDTRSVESDNCPLYKHAAVPSEQLCQPISAGPTAPSTLWVRNALLAATTQQHARHSLLRPIAFSRLTALSIQRGMVSDAYEQKRLKRLAAKVGSGTHFGMDLYPLPINNRALLPAMQAFSAAMQNTQPTIIQLQQTSDYSGIFKRSTSLKVLTVARKKSYQQHSVFDAFVGTQSNPEFLLPLNATIKMQIQNRLAHQNNPLLDLQARLMMNPSIDLPLHPAGMPQRTFGVIVPPPE